VTGDPDSRGKRRGGQSKRSASLGVHVQEVESAKRTKSTRIGPQNLLKIRSLSDCIPFLKRQTKTAVSLGESKIDIALGKNNFHMEVGYSLDPSADFASQE
jgi:hypothetical protein